jgi:hypothetical protein
MRALLTATAILLVTVPAVAQPDRWTFDVLTIRKNYYNDQVDHGRSTIKHTPYGIFASRDECEIARAGKIAELDDRNARQSHSTPAEASKTTTTGGAAVAAAINQADQMVTKTTHIEGQGAGRRETTVEVPSRVEERNGVNDCRAF